MSVLGSQSKARLTRFVGLGALTLVVQLFSGQAASQVACSAARLPKGAIASSKLEPGIRLQLEACSKSLLEAANRLAAAKAIPGDEKRKVRPVVSFPTIAPLEFDRQKNITSNRDRAIILFNEQQRLDTQRELRDLLQQQQLNR